MAYERVNWENLPSTKTPINQTNLNKMENGIDQAGAEIFVGTEEPTTVGKVWFRKGKNLFDKNNKQISNNAGYYQMNGTTQYNANYTYLKLSYKIGEKLTYSGCNSASGTNVIIFNFYQNENFLSQKMFTVTSGTITIPDNCDNFTFSFPILDKDTIQIEQGSKATSYEAYIEPKIYVRNSNGVYEEFIKKSEEVYSTKETKIGTWIDGKPLYRKVIESTTFTTDFYPVSSNIRQFINQYGYVQRKDYKNIWQPIPSRTGNAMSISFLASNPDSGVQIDWGSSWKSDHANFFNKIVLIVEYTKTMD